MFHCTGIFIMSVEHVLHKINSFWNLYYILNFLRNEYYRGTSVPSRGDQCYYKERYISLNIIHNIFDLRDTDIILVLLKRAKWTQPLSKY